mgnify:CR=1 FL=1
MSAATTSAAGRLTDAELKAQEKAARKAEKARQKRIAADEAAERKRSAKAGFANVNNPRRSTLLTVLCAVFAVYCLFPFVYLLINATKTQADFTSTFGLGFGKTFAQFALVADGDASLFQGIQELVKGFVAQTAHFQLLFHSVNTRYRFNNALYQYRLTKTNRKASGQRPRLGKNQTKLFASMVYNTHPCLDPSQ